jgi:hypothetical protein
MKTLSRRDFLKMTAIGTAGAILAACQPAAAPTAPVTQAPEAPKQEEPTQAPVSEATPTQAPPKAEAIKITMVESWFGVRQYKEASINH